MKSYNHLFEKFLTKENCLLAIKNAAQKKSKKTWRHRKARYIRDHPDQFVDSLLEYAGNFKNHKHKPKVIYDGIARKKRTIIVPDVEEQIIHHMIVNVLKPIFQKSMYYHSYGSLPNKGAHRGKKAIEKWLKKYPDQCKYCLKTDIKKFFENIPHDILKQKFRDLIHDERMLKVIFEVIDVTDVGIPLGFYTSQWIANWYLTGLDHFIKERLRRKVYARYMDDMEIYGNDKAVLHRVREQIDEFLRQRLGLRLKENWQVYLFSRADGTGRDLDFMGFRFFCDRTILRRNIMLKATRKARRICKKKFKTIYDCRQMLSYLGWIKYTDTHSMYTKHIKPFISFRKLKQYVSKHQKEANKLCGISQKTQTTLNHPIGS